MRLMFLAHAFGAPEYPFLYVLGGARKNYVLLSGRPRISISVCFGWCAQKLRVSERVTLDHLPSCVCDPRERLASHKLLPVTHKELYMIYAHSIATFFAFMSSKAHSQTSIPALVEIAPQLRWSNSIALRSPAHGGARLFREVRFRSQILKIPRFYSKVKVRPFDDRKHLRR